MSVTASRIGTSPVTIDWQNLARISPPTFGSQSVKRFEPDTLSYQETWDKLSALFNSGQVGFYHAVSDEALSQIRETDSLTEKLLSSEIFTDCLFLGIGGSALGPISLLNALKERCHSKIRFHFQENPDQSDWNLTLQSLNPAKTLVCAVTKSGGTFETIAQFLLALDWLGKARWKSHVVAITDPSNGDLRTFVNEQGLMSLSIAPSIGGRFSIFTPVGLFAAGLSGLSMSDFLAGAKQVRDYTEKTALEKNPLFLLADQFIRHYSKRPIHVCMPYSTLLRPFGQWFVQLWGESLGKDGKGFTPLAAMGTTDQHSILQLLRDGPDDKITFFITIGQTRENENIPNSSHSKIPTHSLPGTIPSQLLGVDFSKYQSFANLKGHRLSQLMNIEYQATAKVLTNQSRPHVTFQIDELSEKAMGALYFTMSLLTSITGVHWEINPFDQPGVEEAKIYIRQALNFQPEHFSPSSEEF